MVAGAVDVDMVRGRHEAADLCQAREKVGIEAVGRDVRVGDGSLLNCPPDNPLVGKDFITRGDGMLHPVNVKPKFRR